MRRKYPNCPKCRKDGHAHKMSRDYKQKGITWHCSKCGYVLKEISLTDLDDNRRDGVKDE